jgi:hypothetical protein
MSLGRLAVGDKNLLEIIKFQREQRVALLFTLKKYLKAKEELWKLK